LNEEAAAHWKKNKDEAIAKAREWTAKYCSPEPEK